MKNINWHDIRTVMAQWVIFAFLLLLGFDWWLLRDKQIRQKELNRCQSNWQEVEKQIGSGRIILELK